jgi:cytochrome c oxidase subunit 2
VRRPRLHAVALTALTAVVLTVVASAPAAAAGYDSVTEALLRNLHRRLLIVATVLGLMVEGALVYAAVKFHRNDDPKPTVENRRLEITWTVAVAVVLLFVGASSYVVLADPMVSTAPGATQSSDAGVNVEIVGQNWFWTFNYPEENVTTRNTLVIPENRTLLFSIRSTDVIHSVHIPELGVKQDAIPGQTTTFRTRATDTGTYRLYCAEFCGAGHSKMLATVKVVTPAEYQQWLRQQRESSTQTATAGTSETTSTNGTATTAARTPG